jgi:outer membrane protein assembly factor BamB
MRLSSFGGDRGRSRGHLAVGRGRWLALLLVCVCACAAVGKGDYRWLGGENRLPSGKGALRVMWRRELTPAKRGAYRPVENAVAAIDSQHQRVYVGAESGRLTAVDFDGQGLYRFELDEPIECEPALDVEKDELYVGNERGELYAFTPSTGKLRFDKPMQSTGSIRRRPLLLNDAVYVITEDDVIEAFARATGDVLWRYNREREEGFLVAGHSGITLAEGGRLLAAFNDGTVVALDTLDGKVKWERPTSLDVPEVEPGRPRYTDVDTTPVVIDGLVYAASFGAGLYALDLNNGSVVMRDPEWTGITGMAATDDGALIVISADRGVARIDPHTRAASWIRVLERGSFGVPELFEGMLVLGDSRGSLVALDVETGDELGRIDAGHGFVARASIVGGRGFVVTNGGVLLALRVMLPKT